MNERGPRLIKRYQNRKLYDTTDSCYVTLEDISELIKEGEDIRVIDNATKEDLTSVTLSQIIFEEEKKQKSVPLSTLTTLVRSGGEAIREIAHKALESGAREIANVRHEFYDVVDRLVHRGQLTQEDRNKLMHSVRDFIDDKIRPTVENVSNIPTVQSELKALQRRIEELERHIRDFERTKKKK